MTVTPKIVTTELVNTAGGPPHISPTKSSMRVTPTKFMAQKDAAHASSWPNVRFRTGVYPIWAWRGLARATRLPASRGSLAYQVRGILRVRVAACGRGVCFRHTDARCESGMSTLSMFPHGAS